MMPNFVQLLIVVSGLKYIERTKLAKMPQLKVLNFYGNHIEHFDEDVFNDLRNLEMLAFVHNKIKVLPSKLLWNLNNLKEILSFYNPIEAIPANFFKNNKKLEKFLMKSRKMNVFTIKDVIHVIYQFNIYKKRFFNIVDQKVNL
ncbi:hypothetical protein ACKWTF_016810 [Chironomus riparius]